MRQRLEYNSSQQQLNLYTSGSEWQLPDGAEYIGPYHRYTTGEIFTQPRWNPSRSQPLQPYRPESTEAKRYRQLKNTIVTFQPPRHKLVTITPADRAAGYVTRWFLWHVTRFELIEIDETQYTSWLSQRIDPVLYAGFSINWYISGALEDEMKNGILHKGVKTQNTEQLVAVGIPQIFTYFTNPAEYYADSDYVIPRDINNLDS